MNLTPRAARRAGAALALAGLTGLAVLLPVTALGAITAPSQPAIAATPACTGANTQAWLGLPGDGTAGTIFYQLEFSNIGHSPCTLTGFPGVSARRANGHQVGPGATREGTSNGPVILAPGATAHVVLGFTDAGAVCAHPVHTATLRVFAPGEFRAQVLPLAGLACASHSVLRVRAVAGGAGIPGFTIR